MSVAIIGGAITALLGVTSKLLDKTPDYNQKKKENFFKMKNAYEAELKKEYSQRDDDMIMNLREEIVLFAGSFSKEIKDQ